jgi:hypothetical protein
MRRCPIGRFIGYLSAATLALYVGVVPGDPTSPAFRPVQVSQVAAAGAPLPIEAPAVGSTAQVHRPADRLVLAAYFQWYALPWGPSEHWGHWTVEGVPKITHHPQFLYDSRDRDLMRYHIQQAESAGIDSLVVSWWGMGEREDKALRMLLDEAEAIVSSVRVSVQVELAGMENLTEETLIYQLGYLVEQYAEHPNYLRVGSRPVFFLYNAMEFSSDLAQWQRIVSSPRVQRFAPLLIIDQISEEVLDIFDGYYLYGPLALWFSERIWDRYLNGSYIARREGKVFVATVAPGYDDRPIRNPSWNDVVPRDEGHTYDAMWRMALEFDPDWIFINSWNEWHEGMEIEPSREHGDQYLFLTREYVRQFRANASRP